MTGQMRTWYTSKPTLRATKSHISHVVGDSAWEGYTANTFEARDEVLVQIGRLGYKAYEKAESFQLDHYPDTELDDAYLDLPKGWRIETTEPVKYSQDGVCYGGVLVVEYKNRRLILVLKPPLGKPVPAVR